MSSIGSERRMFRVRASKALEAINDEDHYHRPAAGGFSSSTMTPSDPTNQEEAAQADNSIDALSSSDNNNQTLSFTLTFLSLMIVYIGFCFHYRKVKDTSTHQNNNNTNNRNRQRRNNQAVLDESSSRANRAAADEEDQRKLEERKQRIGEVLWSRLIVEDDEENDEEENNAIVKKVGCLEDKGGKKDEGISVNAASDSENSGEDDEENQDMNDRNHGQEENYDEEMGMKAAAVEEKALAQDENVASAVGTLATPSNEEATVATVPSSSSEETTIATMPSNSDEVMPTIGASPSSSTSMVAVVSPPSSPPSSPFRKYADALSCNSCHHHATNYCNNNNIISDASTHNNTSPGNKSPSDSPSSLTTTITLSTIQQTYGEECNICLSNFQVGDRAAWSKHHFNGCTHVFHDECMKRWLLVRDGCPICRRSFLNGVVEKKIPEEQVIGGVEDEGESRDLESGGGGGGSIANATIIPEE